MRDRQGHHLTFQEMNKLNRMCGGIINYRKVIIDKSYLKKFVKIYEEESVVREEYRPGMRHSEMLKVWPPLVNGDLAILRLRITNIIEYVTPYAIQAVRNMDYVTAANVLVYSLVFPEWFTVLVEIGVFTNRTTLIAFGKAVTPSIKRIITNEDDRQAFVEINSLAGYQQAEPEGWSMKDEVEQLAHGGNQHGLLGTDIDLEFMSHFRL
jgi:hypothetical protein